MLSAVRQRVLLTQRQLALDNVAGFAAIGLRGAHTLKPVAQIVPPTAEIPDVQTFMKKIGRDASETTDHFESWEHFMTASSEYMKEKGIDTRLRRYIISQREKFRQGLPVREYKRGKKSWGGERKRDEFRAQHFGRLRAEQRESKH
jgi:hypothetical protein